MFADFEYEDARKVLVRYFPESQVPNRRTIVVIDDNDDNRFVFRTFLEDKYEIEEFADGQKALHGLKEMRAHVIFLDISLPGLDGVEILRQIRQDIQLQHIPVVALTAHAMLGDRERFLRLGFNDYISKPILDLQVLTHIIERATRKSPGGTA